ncbi:MAG: hypothetical protein C9356_12450 [Oleiphilus sp.]|nr:MAG: hypothetical protein C9356_12450 [Oleiphilus sp.]
MKNTPHTIYDFKGLDDWFEVFRAGTQTDSKGREATFTQDDLDSIVANHSAEQPAPLVVGHPQQNHPAYGWTAGLKRDGDVLLAKAQDVVPEFQSAVEAKQYRHRSVSLVPAENGYRLRHIGFLGAVAPAVPGLKDIAFNAGDESATFEFSVDDAVRSVSWRFGSIATLFRRFKNWFIEQEGAEAAEQLIPEYTLEDLTTAQERITSDLDRSELKNSFQDSRKNSTDTITIHSDSPEETPMSDKKSFSQADLDAAVEAAVAPLKQERDALKQQQQEASFNTKRQEATTFVNGLVDKGVLLPSQSGGMIEFLAALDGDEESSFEFSVGEGEQAQTKKSTPQSFMKEWLSALPKQIEFNRKSDAGDDLDDSTSSDYAAPNGMTVDPDRAALDKKAMDYSKQHNVDYATAVQLVAQEDS